MVVTTTHIAPLYANHSTWADGAEQFADWLCKQPGVSKVSQGNVRSSHVRNRPRDPVFEVTKHSVRATWYRGGSLQLFHVFAKPEHNKPKGNVRRLSLRLVKAWEASQQRGGVGASPKDEVVLPAHIQRRMAQDATARPTATSPMLTLTPEVQMNPATPLVLPAKLAKAYELLLAYAHDTFATDFEIEGATKLVCDEFGKGAGMRLCRGLQDLKLLSRGRVPTQKTGQGRGAHLRRVFTVHRKPFTIDPATAVPARTTTKSRRPVRTAKVKGGAHGDPFDHLHWLSKHWTVIKEGEQRMNALRRHGVEVVRSRDGRLSLVEIKQR